MKYTQLFISDTLDFSIQNVLGLFKQGTTAEGVCTELTYLPITRTLAKDHTLSILCNQSPSNQNAVEVAMVSSLSLIIGC